MHLPISLLLLIGVVWSGTVKGETFRQKILQACKLAPFTVISFFFIFILYSFSLFHFFTFILFLYFYLIILLHYRELTTNHIFLPIFSFLPLGLTGFGFLLKF